MRTLLNHLGYGSGNRPSAPQTVQNGGGASADALRPRSHRQPFPVVSQVAIRAGIAVLLFGSGPAAVGREVPLASVDPVNRGPIRARPHVSEEVLESVPSFANGDSGTAVLVIATCGRAEAPASHALPRRVGRSRPANVWVASPDPGASAANARRGVFDGGSRHGLFSSARTAAPPRCRLALSSASAMSAKHNPVAESLPSQVLCSWCSHAHILRRTA